mmetsp:Transcript_34050/g.63572  ORF Transcript_34050/g.63572 Transcript_34050/m.63572 type:complete len:454 (+) Transcript_34050:121-1482(+)
MAKKFHVFNKIDAVIISGILFLVFFTAWLLYIRDNVAPMLALPHSFKYGKLFREQCGPSTNSSLDLLIGEELTLEEGSGVLRTHGSAIIPSILSDKTAKSLRQYIIGQNNIIGHSYVLEPHSRIGLMLGADVPVIQQAFQEISDHLVLKPLLDDALGPHSSLTGFMSYTTMAGALAESWHSSSPRSYAAQPEYFVKELDLVLYLQDTSPAMGSAESCPGTHTCSRPLLDYNLLQEQFNSSEFLSEEYDNLDQYLEQHLPCGVSEALAAGDGVLVNRDVLHRNRAHNAGEDIVQVSVVFTFSESLRKDVEDESSGEVRMNGGVQGSRVTRTRTLPVGGEHMLRWDMWGHTVDDMSTLEDEPWRLWHSLGMFLKENPDGSTPFTLWDVLCLIFVESQRRPSRLLLVDEFSLLKFHAWVSNMLWLTSAVTLLYLCWKVYIVLLRAHQATLRANKMK